MTENAVFACPSCALALSAGAASPPSCPRCRLTLVGPVAAELGELDRELASLGGHLSALHVRRQQLLEQLRAPAIPAVAAPGVARFEPGTRPSAPSGPLPVQATLLGLGALLLAVAGTIFTVVAYGRLGIGGRAAILVAVTGIAAASSVALHRGGLTATADAVGVLTLALTTLDLHAVRILARPDIDLVAWWTLVVAVLAVLGGGGGMRLRLPATTTVGVIAAQFVLPLGAVVLLDDVAGPRPVGVAVAVALVTSAVADLTGWQHTAAATWAGAGRRLALGAGLAELVVGTLLAADVALDVDSAGEAVPGATALLVAAAGFGWAARIAVTGGRQPDDTAAPLAAGAAAAAVLGAVVAVLIQPWQHLSPDEGVLLLLPALLGLVIGLAALGLPAVVRSGPAAVGVGTTLLAAGIAAGTVLGALAAPLALLARPWPSVPPSSVSDVLGLIDYPAVVDLADVLLVVLAAVALAVADRQWGRQLRPAVVIALGGALLLVPAAIDLPLVVALVGALLIVAVAVAVTALDPARERVLQLAVPFAGTALAWSAADELLTLLTLAVLALLGTAVGTSAREAAGAAGAGVGAVCALALPPVAVLAAGGGVISAGVVLSATAAVGLVALDRPTPGPCRTAVLAVGGLAALLGLAMAGTDPTWLALVLTGLGVAALLGSLRPGRQLLAVLGVGALTAASWVRLAELHVTTPEAYTLPPALVLLVAGEVVRRRRPDLDTGLLLGPGLSLALVPSLLASFGDDGALRPLLLTVAAFAAVVVGSSLRLRAPLLIGGGVLAAVAIRQLGPLAVQAPRWVLLGGVGFVLLVLGARYERARAEVERLRRSFGRLG